jgi:hypothetical protein
VKCAYCNREKYPEDMELLTVAGQRRVTCPCYREFADEELERFQEWLRAHPLRNAFLVVVS